MPVNDQTPNVYLYGSEDVELPVLDGVVVPVNQRGMPMVGTDGTNLRFIKTGTDGRGSILIQNTVSTVNSTTTPLGISGVFTGTSEDVLNYASIAVGLRTDQASAVDGLSIQWSPDGVNWDQISAFAITANVQFFVNEPIRSRFFRVVYTNGALAQTFFRLQTIYSQTSQVVNKFRVQDVPKDDDPSQLVKAVIAGKTTAGGGAYVDVKVSPSGAVQVGGSVAIDGYPTGTLANGAQTAVGAAAVQVLAANANRKAAIIQNVGVGTMRVGVVGVTATTGVKLATGATVIFEMPYCPTVALYAIRDGAPDTTALAQEIT